MFKTQMGEISVHAKEITVLSKSLEPQPVNAINAAAVSARAIPFFKFMGISFLSAMTIIHLL